MHNTDTETVVKQFVNDLADSVAICPAMECAVLVYLSEMDMACPGCGDIGITKAMTERLN